MALKFLVLQHIDWEPPGKLLVDAARQLDISLEVIKIYRQAAPDPADFDALLLLGGPPNVHEENRYPFLREEKRLLKAWLAMNRPCLGFCLGHQLLADALGAEIGRNFMPGTGFIRGYLTHAGSEHPIFKNIKSPLTLFKWHGQSVQTPLPRDLLMLATSSQCVIEAFSVAGRPHIIGLQCDNHAAHPDDVRSWLHHDRKWINSLPDGEELGSALTDEAEQRLTEMQSTFLQIMNNFVTLVLNNKT
ncbi:MAG TPA: type 1 glutamine amidotransferase [Desulfobulbus sp.]|nr:type 1 glutamine amidotransferase [Desulfobulbus sp.]